MSEVATVALVAAWVAGVLGFAIGHVVGEGRSFWRERYEAESDWGDREQEIALTLARVLALNVGGSMMDWYEEASKSTVTKGASRD